MALSAIVAPQVPHVMIAPSPAECGRLCSYTAVPPMIPIRDVIPSRTTPGITLVLIAVNVLVFGVMVAADGGPPDNRPVWITQVLSLFHHGSLIHLVGNLWALWLFGENVEDRFGHWRFLLCYIAVGSVAALAELWVAPLPGAPLSGASGAVAGIVAAYLVMFPRSRLLTLVPTGVPWNLLELPAAGVAATWFVLHVGRGTGPLTLFVGAVAGVGAAWVLRRPERQRVEWWAE
jgi:membrane associated rhomboid family serine protease